MAELTGTTFDKVKKIIVEQLGVDEAEVTPEASITDDLGADSLDQVELVMRRRKSKRSATRSRRSTRPRRKPSADS